MKASFWPSGIAAMFDPGPKLMLVKTSGGFTPLRVSCATDIESIATGPLTLSIIKSAVLEVGVASATPAEVTSSLSTSTLNTPPDTPVGTTPAASA